MLGRLLKEYFPRFMTVPGQGIKTGKPGEYAIVPRSLGFTVQPTDILVDVRYFNFFGKKLFLRVELPRRNK